MARSRKQSADSDAARVPPDTEERRVILRGVTFRDAEKDGDASTIEGYAAVVNQETVIGGLWGWREKIAPGAFIEALGRDDVRALFNHNADILLGRTASGTLRLSEDATGLRYEVDLPDTAAAKDVRTLIKRGDVSGSSFAFRVEEDEWDETPLKDGKLPLRTITKVELVDVSPVTYPAYPTTSVSARSKAQAISEKVSAQADDAQTHSVDPVVGRDLVRRARARAAVEDARACQA